MRRRATRRIIFSPVILPVGAARAALDEVTSARLDIGSGPERVVDAEGERVQWTFGLYGNVGHAF